MCQIHHILTTMTPIFQTTLITILLLSSCRFPATRGSPITKIFAFGDSYTDTGNTKTSTGPAAFNHVSNPPYGSTFFRRPTNRYSDGRIVLDFLSQSLSLPFLPPYRARARASTRAHGLNFAVGGATAIPLDFFSNRNITFNLVRGSSLSTQLARFDEVVSGRKGALKNALIWAGEIGANDYTCTIGSSVSPDLVRALAVESTAGFLRAVLRKGARRVVVQGLPPTGCQPYSFSLASGEEDRDEMGCVGSVNRVAEDHNSAMKATVEGLRREFPESVIVYADYYNAVLELLRRPRKYGFKEAFKACCGYGGGPYNFDVFNTCGSAYARKSCDDPSEYVNWDGAHFTEGANKVLADLFLNGSFCSPSFSYLVRKKVHMG